MSNIKIPKDGKSHLFYAILEEHMARTQHNCITDAVRNDCSVCISLKAEWIKILKRLRRNRK